MSHEKPSTFLLNETDRRLIALLDDLPLVDNPWKPLAETIGIAPVDLLRKLETWSQAGFFRHLRALFNSDKLGYRSTLSAVAVDEDQVDPVAQAVSQSPFVSHNFLRQGSAFNLWFTLTCPDAGPTLEETIAEFSRRFQRPVRRFDTVRYFKISFKTLFAAESPPVRPARDDSPARTFSDAELIRTVGLLQEELPLAERPFLALARNAGLSETELIESARDLRNRKILRRLGTILDLKNIEENQNAMCVWDPPEEQIDRFGRHAAGFPRISHCYQRVHYPDWPWKIYTVFHGHDRRDCLNLIAEVAREFPHVPRLTLWTLREYKQTPIRYDPQRIRLA